MCEDYDGEIVLDANGEPIEIGNGICDHGKEYLHQYMNEECGWVFGDCIDVRKRDIELQEKYPDCKDIDIFFKIGDGICDGGEYLTEECGWDGYDCCEADQTKIGDGKCDSRDSGSEGLYINRECGYEDYDCCNVKNLAGNGICMDAQYNNGITSVTSSLLECARDGGDCDVKVSDFAEGLFAFGQISVRENNLVLVSFSNLFSSFVKGFPDCSVKEPKLVGDGVCHGGLYNVESCGWDGGDCVGMFYL